MAYFHRLTYEPLTLSSDGSVYTLIAHDSQTQQRLTLQARHVRWQGSHLGGYLTLQRDNEVVFVAKVFALTDCKLRNSLLGLLDRPLWGPALNRFANELLAQQGQRLQAVCLADGVPEEAPGDYWQIDPLPPVILDDLTVWFGDGGVGKSYLALYAGGLLATRGFRVLYADWEMSYGRHVFRLRQLFPTDIPRGVFYVSCDAPLVQLGQDLVFLIEKHRIDFVIVDSVARACQGDAERNEVATSYLAVAKSLGVGSLHIAHVTKSTGQTADKPFGSVFWHNGARDSWSIARAPEYDRDEAVGLVMRQRKSNFAAPQTTPYALQLVAEHGRMFVQPVGGEEYPEDLLIPARAWVRRALEEGPLTRDELRERCRDVRPAAFRQALHREREAGAVIDLGDGFLALNETPSA
jgi:hypothetical protein